MAIKASNQISLVDLTDGYSVILTNETHTFLGSTNAVDGTQVTSSIIQAMCGSEIVSCKVGTISAPTGLSIVSDGKTPRPTLTITATSALTKSGSVTIPVEIGDITISKLFTWSIAFKGTNGTSVSVKSTSIMYQASSNGVTVPTGTWVTQVPTVPDGQFLWTRTIVEYTDGKSTTAYSVSRQGSNGTDGTSVTITKTEIVYQASSNGTTAPNGTWSADIPTVPSGQFLWTRTTVTYSDNTKTISYSVSRQGANGKDGVDGVDGVDALTLIIESSNGNIFKNTDIATTLTARVYKGAAEVTGAALSALGTIKWYKDGSTTATATGSTLTVQAGDIVNKGTYVAQLEG